MWNELKPTWRVARKQHQCQGDGCTKIIALGERYVDKALRDPAHGHLRYCEGCAVPILAKANSYHFFNGRNDFPERYHQRITSTEWKSLKRTIVEQRGQRCEHCSKESISLELHHVHYRTLGNETPEDLELLCQECHKKADEDRRPTRNYPADGLIVGSDGNYFGKFDPNTIYIPLADGRHVPLKSKLKF